jgi:uncharacterized membrane protein YhhN
VRRQARAAGIARAAGARRLPVRILCRAVFMPSLVARTFGVPWAAGSGQLVAAQTLSWAVDLALMRRDRAPFLVGLGSFLVAHVAYVSAYRCRSSQRLLAAPSRRRLVAGGSLVGAAMAVAAAREDPVVAVPVAAYGATLATMVAAATAVDRDHGRGRLVAGASLFLISDTLIGVRRFLLRDRTDTLETAVMATYAAGQWCISDGMLRGRPVQPAVTNSTNGLP